MGDGQRRRWRSTWVAAAIAVGILAAALVGVSLGDESKGKKAPSALEKTDEIAKKVAELRGLSIRHAIKRGVMTKAQIRQRILERMDQEYDPDDLVAEGLAMKRMGMLPADADYKQMVIDLLTDEIAGFYDPWERELYIAGWQQNSGGMADAIMAHEIDHALQDQHFDLRDFMKAKKNNGDATSARQALVEGDGMAIMIEYMMPSVSPWSDPRIVDMMTENVSASSGSPAMAKAPMILREALVFPYTEGLRFVAYFRQHQPWSRIDQIYKKPPLATEQILHPAKYETYERPDQITARPIEALPGYHAAYDNVTGELGLQLLLRQHGIRDAAAELAAEGWGGDRMVVYAPKGNAGVVDGTIGVQYVVADHTADAHELQDAFADALASLCGPGSTEKQRTDDRAVQLTADGKHACISERRNDAVLLLVAAPADTAETIRDQIWKTWKVTRH